MKKWLWIIVALLVVGCGQRTLDGVYSGKSDTNPPIKVSFTFKSSGKVSRMVFGTEHEVDYLIEGDKIRIKSPMSDTIFTLLEDGSIKGPMGILLKKE